METYRSVWNNFGNYLKEHWKLKDFEKITPEHVEAYFEYKVEYYPSKQYIEKLSSALAKLELALNKLSKTKYTKSYKYDFSIRQLLVSNLKKSKLLVDGYHNRVYKNPYTIIR